MQFSMFSMPSGLLPKRSLRTTEWAPSAPISHVQRTMRPSSSARTWPLPSDETEETEPWMSSASLAALISASIAGRSTILPSTGTSTEDPARVDMRMRSTLATVREGDHPSLLSILSLTASPHMEW